MSTRKDDIEFLEKFRDIVDQYLFLGFAPPTDSGANEYDAEALFKMQQASKKREFQELRRALSQMIPRAKQLLVECDANPILTQLPPPAVGGPVLQFNGLDLITENRSEFQLKKSDLFDAIDRAVGVLRASHGRKKPAIGGGRYVFISHSSKDTTLVSAIKQAFEDLPLTPRFLEDKPGGFPPTKEIAQLVQGAQALFVFFTYNSVIGDTRDWIVFEIGVAVAHDIPVFSWRQNSLVKERLPRLLEQVSRYRDFDLTGDGVIKLTSDVRSAAKGV